VAGELKQTGQRLLIEYTRMTMCRTSTCRPTVAWLQHVSLLWTCCWLVSFGVPLSSQNSPFLQVLSSIAFPINLLARLHGYLTIAGVGTSLMEFSLGSVRQIKLALGSTII